MSEISGPVVFRANAHSDERGSFQEIYVAGSHPAISGSIVQANLIRSRFGVLRGLHVNFKSNNWKLVTAISGVHFSVAVDVKSASPTHGHWQMCRLEEGDRFWIPPSWAHGLLCMADRGIAHYVTNGRYDPVNERSLSPLSDVGISWPLPVSELVIADRDLRTTRLQDLMEPA